MKIGITCYTTYGGSGVLATELAKLLARNGHQIHFITSAVPHRLHKSYEERIYFHIVDTRSYPPFEHSPYALALASKMKDVIVQESLDLLHVHYALPHAISAFLAAKMLAPRKIPIVTTLHGTDITIVGQDKKYFDITRLGIDESCVVTAVSDYLKLETDSFFNPKVEVRRIYNFVDSDLFRPENTSCDRNMFAKKDELIYLHISNFRKVKNVPDVIRIFNQVQQEVNAVLLLLGEGPELREVQELVREFNLEKQVKFLGKQEDIVSFLGISDVLLFPSKVESFGLAALEAMACQVPVVSCKSGGIPEVVLDGVCGYLSGVGDVEALSRQAIELGLSENLRKEFGIAGRKRAMEFFHPNIILPHYETAYLDAMELCQS